MNVWGTVVSPFPGSVEKKVGFKDNILIRLLRFQIPSVSFVIHSDESQCFGHSHVKFAWGQSSPELYLEETFEVN